MDASKLGHEINDALAKMGIGFEIHDIKSDAFGKKGDNYVLLDYFLVSHRGLLCKYNCKVLASVEFSNLGLPSKMAQ